MNHEETKPNNLPDGDYTGRVYISAGTIGDEESLDYGRKQFVIELMLNDEKFKDEMVFLNRVLLPHYLANKPAPTDKEALNKWQAASKIYLEQTNKLLEKCGVDVSEIEGTRFVQQIAQNNISKPIVSFTMKDGLPTIHSVISREKPEALNAEPESLPDGNDAPF
jgi:hypothetical protein